MGRSNNTTCSCSQRVTSRSGKVSIVTCIVVLGMAVMIGMVGNIGRATVAKLEAQNAADAVAFSSAQWMARSMNAITATNHMLGEVTALVTVLEALGGPEVDAQIEFTPQQSKILNNVISSVQEMAPIRGLPTYVPQPVTNIDTRLVDFVADRVAPENKKHKAFATIYDAKMQLKRELATTLILKTAANVGLFVPPPWGYISAAVSYGIHAYSTVELVGITKEWFILEGLEIIVRAARQFKVKVVEDQLVPALAVHGDFIAGDVAGAVAGSGIANISLSESLDDLRGAYKMDEIQTYPRSRKIEIPIETEPGPSRQGRPNAPEWGDDKPPRTGAEDKLDDLTDDVKERKQKIRQRIAQLEQDIALLDRLEADLDKRLAEDEGLTPGDRAAINAEKTEIDATRTEKQADLADAQEKLAKLEAEEQEINQNIASLQQLPATNGNLSVQHLPKNLLDPTKERYTQWVRATYPYVDAYRAPIIAQFKSQLKRSKAAEHFVKWSDRYTLVKAWQFRSGYRFKKQNQQRGEYRRESSTKVLNMYVMKDAFTQGANPREQKGAEPWTKDNANGKKQAELMFTVMGLVHRDQEPLFSPVIYPKASEHGTTTFAQAIFYNANDQQPRAPGATSTQPVVGWDTLNWDPDEDTPEWGAEPSETSPMWPWEIFKGARELGSAKVKLNWQAKLMPVTEGRLQAATAEFVASDMNKNLGIAALHHGQLVNH